MFFEKETISFHILDVLELNQTNFRGFNFGRNFSALSFRFRADTDLKTETRNIHVQDNAICFFPARLDYTRIAAVDEMIVVHFDTPDYLTDKIEFFEPEDPERLKELFREIFRCWSKKEPGYKYRCSAILNEIFAECYVQNFREKQSTSKIAPSVAYLTDHFREADLSIKKLAEQSFISEVYFRKLFKEEFGISPQKYIVKLRIRNAAGLISSGYYSLKEIAYLSGYGDYKYFSVEFKKIMGVSPSEYLYNYAGGGTEQPLVTETEQP